jgi:hypothetical protein
VSPNRAVRVLTLMLRGPDANTGRSAPIRGQFYRNRFIVMVAGNIGRTARLAAVFLALNLGWEIFQIPLYTIWWSEPWSRIVLALLHCTLGDLLIGAIALVFAIGVAGGGWPADRWARGRVVILTTLAGVSYTIFSEWLNVEIRQTWAYTDLMPRLPPLGTGLTPLLQWLLLPGMALTIATRSAAQRKPNKRPDSTSTPADRSSQQAQ